jgi:hypothetical protein
MKSTVAVSRALNEQLNPFHPESRNTLLAKCLVDRSGHVQPRFLPVQINRRRASPRSWVMTLADRRCSTTLNRSPARTDSAPALPGTAMR